MKISVRKDSNWAQKMYGLPIAIVCFIFAMGNLYNFVFEYNLKVTYSLFNCCLLIFTSILLYLSSIKYTKFWKAFQIGIFFVTGLYSLFVNIDRNTLSILPVPADSLFIIAVCVYLMHVHNFLKKHAILKLSMFMCIIFLCVLFSYLFKVDDTNGVSTGIIFVVFAIALIFIYWVGEQVIINKYRRIIHKREKYNVELYTITLKLFNKNLELSSELKKYIDRDTNRKLDLIKFKDDACG